MATYYHGNPEIQAGDHGLQTLVLMNPAYLHQYSSDSSTHPPPPPPNNLVFLNSNSLSHPSPHTSQQFFGIPLPAASTTSVTNQHDISPLHGLVHRLHYNFYNSINDPDPSGGAARETTRAHHQGQGLSLSLSNSQQPAQPGYGSQAQAIPGDHQNMRVSGGGSASLGLGVTSNGVTGMQSRVLLSSKYLKAVQEVLDEVVSFNNSGILKAQLSKKGSEINSNISSKAAGELSAAAADDPGDHGDGGGGKSGAELTASERQEIQMKKAKLISMLDEVWK